MARISVIIPTRNRPDDLRRCLAGLEECSQRLASTTNIRLHEVVVADDGSTRPHSISPAHASPLPVIVVRNRARLGAGASRARAVAVASGDVLAFLDDDAVPRGDWLSVAGSVGNEKPAISGRVLPFDSGLVSAARQARYDARYTALSAGDPVGFFAGGNSAILTSEYESIGGFTRAGVGGDNSLAETLAERGRPVRFEPQLVVAHRNGKGLYRALVDALSSGRDHPVPLAPQQAFRLVTTGAVGSTQPVRALNFLLGTVHAAGRVNLRTVGRA